MVEQPSPWTDQQRARMLGLTSYRRGIHKCGVHDSIRRNPDNVFVPDQDDCPLCAALEVQQRVVGEADERYKKQLGDTPDPKTPRPWDGRSLLLRPATEAELIERARRGGQ